jgi:sec-independent protein translocase protein TatC
VEDTRVPAADSTREPADASPDTAGQAPEAPTEEAATGDELQVHPEPYDVAPAAVERAPTTGGGGGGVPPSSGGGGGGGGRGNGGGGGDEEEEMAKMSFLEHLEELRSRIIRSLVAVAIAFFLCFAFAQKIFEYMSEPVRAVLRELKLADTLYFTGPTHSFTLLLNLALVAALFAASPVVLYQVWAFIAPGLYRRERRYAVPFVFFCSGLFIAGGCFGYFIAFPYALKFLLTFGGPRMTPWITVTEYVDMFWTVMLGLGLIFELPVLMMFLGLLGIVSPGFLLRNFRYAILLIFIVAAVVTPTSDVMNMMIFAIPMIGLFVLGIALVWLVQRKRKSRWEWR